MPIELVWNDLKYFLCTVIKPQTQFDLIKGVRTFWKTKVYADYCDKNIDLKNKDLKKMRALT